MPNLAIHKPGSDVILKFFINPVVGEREIDGENMRASLSRPLDDLGMVWTDDVAEPQYDADGNFTGYDMHVSDLAPAAVQGARIRKPGRAEYIEAMSKRDKLAALTAAQVEQHVRARLTGLPSALIDMQVDLALVVWGHIKLSDYHRSVK